MEKTLLTKYVQNVTPINNTLINSNENITFKYFYQKNVAPAECTRMCHKC